MNVIQYLSVFCVLSLLVACHGPRKGGGRNNSSGRGGFTQRDSSAEAFIERLDVDGDGKVSKDEFDGPDEHFREADQDSDGHITIDEAPTGPPRRSRA